MLHPSTFLKQPNENKTGQENLVGQVIRNIHLQWFGKKKKRMKCFGTYDQDCPYVGSSKCNSLKSNTSSNKHQLETIVGPWMFGVSIKNHMDECPSVW